MLICHDKTIFFFFFRKKPRGKCCAGMPYYPSTEACCDGQLSSLVGITSPACCEKEVYDSNQKVIYLVRPIQKFTNRLNVAVALFSN